MADLPTGPKSLRSTVLAVEQEAIIVAFRKHTLLPLDDCLYALEATIPQLTRYSLHRCLERHGISRLPEMEGTKPRRQKFDRYPIGYFHLDLAEVRTGEGKLYLFVAIDHTCWSQGTDHRLTKPNHPWTNGQVERRNRAIKEATVKRYHYDSHHPLKAPLDDFVAAYNFAKRLKSLARLTAYEFICKCWQNEPNRFTLNPTHQMQGLYT